MPSRRQPISERSIQSAIVDRLRWHGWVVRELSQPRAVFGELIGVPDVIAWKMGHTLLIECKSKRGKLRESQIAFFDEIEPHIATTLQYAMANDVDRFAAWLKDHETICSLVTVDYE